MNVARRLRTMPLFWQLYGFIVALLIFVVGLAEFILEPLAEELLAGIYRDFEDWHETIIWTASILLPSLACGYVLSKALTDRLAKMSKASKALSRGNLHARLPVAHNDNDPFDVMAQSFNDMAGAIERQLNNERRLLADISHELRSPLTRMAIALELLHKRHVTESSEPLYLRLEKELDNMRTLVDILLSQGRDKLENSGSIQALDVVALVTEMTDDFAFQAGAQGKRISVRLPAAARVSGYPILLRRMLGNILSNAVFYTPQKGTVHVELAVAGGRVVLSVRDFGPGVPDEQLEDIFRAFYRVDSSRARENGGVGLGLALAREAAFRHGGSITARNARPGLEIAVTLPEQKSDAGPC